MQDLAGKTAFITGGASGIGFAMAEAFLKEGMKVVIADVDDAALAEAKIRLKGDNALLAVQLDVTDRDQFAAVADQVEAEMGPVHVLCNNAGVYRGGVMDEVTYNDWDWIMGVNVGGVINGVQTFVERIKQHGQGGHIVNTASMAGLVYGGGAYGVTKHGVVALTESAHFELEQKGSKVKVSVLCPGFVQTRIIESQRNRQERYGSTASLDPTEEQQTQINFITEMIKQGMPPSELADIVFDHIRRERLYILTHDNFNDIVANRTQTILSGENPQRPAFL